MFDPDRLVEAALEVERRHPWPLPSRVADNGVHDGYARITLAAGGRIMPHRAEPLRFVLDELAPVQAAYLTRLEPGGYILPHRDAGPYWDRRHVTIVPAGTEWAGDREEPVHPAAGELVTIRHWRRHAVRNDDPAVARVILLVDRAVPAGVDDLGFALYDD